MRISAWALAAALAAGPASAAVVDAQPNGFQVRSTVQTSASPEKAWTALTQIGRWWNPEHSWSGDAANLSLEARAGGCFCEKLPGGGSVQHMVVVWTDGKQMLRARGALGPLQDLGVDGAVTWTIKAAPGGSEIVQTATLGGYAPGGLTGLAPVVDAVLGEQLTRLKSYLDTGRPAP